MPSELTVAILYYALTLILLFIFGSTGNLLISLVDRQNMIEKRSRLLVSPVVGIAFYTLVSLVIVKNTGRMSSGKIWAVTGFVFAIIFSIHFTKAILHMKPVRWRFTDIQLRILLVPLLGLAPYLPLLLLNTSSQLTLTSATWANNDLGAYIQHATNILRSGFKENLLIDNYLFGWSASIDHPGAQSLFAAISALLSRPPHELGIVLMSTIICSLSLVCTAIVMKVTGNKPSAYLWGFVCVFNPVFLMLIVEFFYAQILTISVLVAIYALLISNLKKDWRLNFLIAGLAVTAFVVSAEIPVILLPLITVSGFMAGSDLTSRKIRDFARQVGFLIMAFGVAFVLLGSTFTGIITLLLGNTKADVAGWKLDLTSPSMFFGFLPGPHNGGPYSKAIRLIDFVVLVHFLYLLTYVSVYKHYIKSMILLVSGIALIQILAVLLWGIDGYQTWKISGSLLVFGLLVLGILLIGGEFDGRSMKLVVVSAFIIGVSFNNAGNYWIKGGGGGYIEKDLKVLMNSDEFKRQRSINILLNPYFETMAASAIPKVPVRMSSSSYQYPNGQSLKYLCTITRKNLLQNFPHGDVKKELGEFVLVGTPKCR